MLIAPSRAVYLGRKDLIMSNKERLIEFIHNLTTEECEYIIACFKNNK